MEMLRDEGKARSIGVSNFRISDLEESQKGANVSSRGFSLAITDCAPSPQVVPAVNQVRFEALWDARETFTLILTRMRPDRGSPLRIRQGEAPD
jgi:aryl-alcohol dehydrogenase-like predicted oxidoreductase